MVISLGQVNRIQVECVFTSLEPTSVEDRALGGDLSSGWEGAIDPFDLEVPPTPEFSF